MKLEFCLLLAFFINLIRAETHTWYYKVGWVNANPDGCLERPVIGFNDSWPLPTLRAKTGDRIQLYLTNGFEEERNTTLHFHGLFQNGSNQMDGPEMVTQCPIPNNQTYLYNFTVPNQAGTFWYHSHTAGQYGDGMRGIFIIDPVDGYPYDFDEEAILPLGEWYHDTADYLIQHKFMTRFNPTGAEPIPQNLLFNNTRNNTWNVEYNKTYLLRIINVGGFVSQYFWIEDHEMDVVEVDGIWVERNTTSMIYITVAQRYSVLLKTKESAEKNFAMMTAFDLDMLDRKPKELEKNSTNYLIYDESFGKPNESYVDSWDDFLDDFYLKPLTKDELLPEADHVITIDVVMDNLGDGINYAFFNGITYTKPKVPTLVTALSAGEYATNSAIYGTDLNAFVLQKDDIVDIRLNNQDTGKHPFHLHGHTFQVITRAPPVPDEESPVAFNESDHEDYPEYPMVRDTVYVNAQSNIVMRFKADNPGVWFFHCHIEWHLDQGLAIVLVEAPLEMQKDPRQELSDDFKKACNTLGMNVTGNAAGNSVNYLDLTGENRQYKALPSGFTARGIVALVFSCIAAFLGIGAIAFYGMADIKDVEARVARDLDIDLDDDDVAEEITETSSDAVDSHHK